MQIPPPAAPVWDWPDPVYAAALTLLEITQESTVKLPEL
jgi:hypothetical protein